MEAGCWLSFAGGGDAGLPTSGSHGVPRPVNRLDESELDYLASQQGSRSSSEEVLPSSRGAVAGSQSHKVGESRMTVVWVVLGVVVAIVILIAVLYGNRQTPEPERGRATPARPEPQRLSAADMLARVRRLQASNAQWAEIWSELNPGNDPTLQQLLLDLRNDGLQFAPSDGLRKIELVCEGLTAAPGTDAAAVLRQVLGQQDILDKFK